MNVFHKNDQFIPIFYRRYLKSEPLVSKAAINGLTDGTFSITKGNILNVNGGYGIGKDIHVLVKSTGKEVFNGQVALDTAHFLKTTYKVDEQQVKALTEAVQDQIKKDMEIADREIRQRFETVQSYGTQKLEIISKELPDFKQFGQEYSAEIMKLAEELKADENIKKAIEVIGPAIEEFSKYFEEFLNIAGSQFTTLQQFCQGICNQITAAFNERVLPELKKFNDSLHGLLNEVISQGVKLITAALERAAKALKEFEADFNKLSQSVKDLTGGVFESITTFVNEIIQEVKGIYEQVIEAIKSLPGKLIDKFKCRDQIFK